MAPEDPLGAPEPVTETGLVLVLRAVAHPQITLAPTQLDELRTSVCKTTPVPLTTTKREAGPRGVATVGGLVPLVRSPVRPAERAAQIPTTRQETAARHPEPRTVTTTVVKGRTPR